MAGDVNTKSRQLSTKVRKVQRPSLTHCAKHAKDEALSRVGLGIYEPAGYSWHVGEAHSRKSGKVTHDGAISMETI